MDHSHSAPLSDHDSALADLDFACFNALEAYCVNPGFVPPHFVQLFSQNYQPSVPQFLLHLQQCPPQIQRIDPDADSQSFSDPQEYPCYQFHWQYHDKMMDDLLTSPTLSQEAARLYEEEAIAALKTVEVHPLFSSVLKSGVKHKLPMGLFDRAHLCKVILASLDTLITQDVSTYATPTLPTDHPRQPRRRFLTHLNFFIGAASVPEYVTRLKEFRTFVAAVRTQRYILNVDDGCDQQTIFSDFISPLYPTEEDDTTDDLTHIDPLTYRFQQTLISQYKVLLGQTLSQTKEQHSWESFMKSLLTFFGFVAFYGNRMYAPARLCPSGTGAQTGFCSLAKRQSTKASNDHQQAAPNYDMNIYMALEQGMESFFSLVQDSDYQLMLDHDKPNMLPPVPTSASPSAKRRSDATDDSPRKKSKTDGTEISENVENNAEIPSSVWTTLDDEESQETPEAALERQAAIQSRARHLRNVFERVVPMFPSNPRANEKGKQPAMGFAYSPSLGAPTPSESPDRDGTGATPDDVQKKVGFHLQGLHLPGGLSVAVSDAGLQAAAAAAAQAGISLPPQLPILAALQEAATHVQFAQSPALLAQVAELQQQQHQQQHAQIDGSAADNANVAHSNDSDDESGDEFGRLSPNSQRDVRFQNRPRKKRQNWTSEEDTALQRGLVQFGHGQWTTIKAEYPELHHRTLGQIRERVKLLMKKHVVVMKHGRDNHDDHDDDGSDDEDSENVYPDAAVAMPLPPDHDHAAASQQDPEDKKKPKTEAKAQRGKSVEVIIQDPPPSSSKPRKMREFWTSEEDAALIAGVKRFGLGRWAQIKTLYAMELQRRGAVQIKDRWRNLTKNGFDPLAA